MPITTAVAPGGSARRARLTAWYGRESRVGEWRGGHGVQVADRHREAGGRQDHVLGEPAVATDSAGGAVAQLAPRAQVLGADAAVRAPPAAPGAVHEHRLADLDAGRPGAERLDRPGHLVAHREWQLVRHRPGGPVHEVQVGMAEAGSLHAQQELARPGHRPRDVAHLHGPLPRDELDGAHARVVRPGAGGGELGHGGGHRATT